MLDRRFEGDFIPDSTWGICKLHNPVGVVRLVGENGAPIENGLCIHCWKESRNESYFKCPTHGINKKSTSGGCPFTGCLGKSSGPTEDEIEREAESLGHFWPGGPQNVENAVDAPAARSQDLGRGEAGPRPEGEAWASPGPNPRGVESKSEERRRVPVEPPSKSTSYIILGAFPTPDPAWKDPFLIEESE